MGKLEELLELMQKGTYTTEDIARKLNVSKEEVKGMLEILKSMGYVKEIQTVSCESCPLRKVCPGKCVRSGVKAYVPSFEL
ncbi:DNA-binding protein [Thermococcus chitonophagus]|uniref:DNA-binding protein n=1 Tax=Thermococcus chitonophagus TaxID=54262 RepID=A0A160VTE2_9EURY|nr:FeoC-like transcriptional regulator [Thermococcus chitonophagus]ASJ17157.1 DNA-binding protein [Thermococcus chitonophagus]CUX77766.1 LexA-related DNA-binding protein [Thermococcus chitonophagus]